jgi:hypothetical protein
MLTDNQNKQTEFMKNTKNIVEGIMKKVRLFHENSQLREKQVEPLSSHTGRHSKESGEEKNLHKVYGIGASLLSQKGGGGTLPKSLGRFSQGITAPIILGDTRTPKEKNGIGAEFGASGFYKDIIHFQPAQNTNSSSSSISSMKDAFNTSFGTISFSIRDDCRCLYLLAFTKKCSVAYGSYGIVVCPEDEPYAYKLIFCQDNGGTDAHVLVDDTSKKIRRSSYRDATYESRISKILEGNESLKKNCILVNGNCILYNYFCSKYIY